MTIYGHAAGNLNSLITCNSTPFYPIAIEFSPEIIELYGEKYYQIFTISFLKFFLIPNLDIIYDEYQSHGIK